MSKNDVEQKKLLMALRQAAFQMIAAIEQYLDMFPTTKQKKDYYDSRQK